MFRTASQLVSRASKQSRSFSAAAGHPDHKGQIRMWKKISIAALPVIAAMMFIVYTEPHHEHEEVKYPYLNIKNKKMPWGDGKTSLFGRTIE